MVMADRVLAYLRKPLNWHAARDDEFVVPIVRGMAQTQPREQARDRILTGDEIRAIWKATELDAAGSYGTLIRVLHLTAQHRQEVGGMRRSELNFAMGMISDLVGYRRRISPKEGLALHKTRCAHATAKPIGVYLIAIFLP
jgi:integrase